MSNKTVAKQPDKKSDRRSFAEALPPRLENMPIPVVFCNLNVLQKEVDERGRA